MTFDQIVDLIKNISEDVNASGSFFHGRTYDTTLEFGNVYPQVHLYPFIQALEANQNIVRSDLLIGFWKEDGHEKTMIERQQIISDMFTLSIQFEAALRASAGVQIISLRREPQYLSQMGVVSGCAMQVIINSSVGC